MYEKLPESLHILKVPVTFFDSYQHAIAYIAYRIEHNIKTFCVAINPEKVYRSQEDVELRETLNSADMQICDGIGIKYAAKILLGKSIKRCTGVQLFFHLIAKATEDNLKIFLLGASPESNERAFKKLKEMHPELNIVGRQHGYFKDDDKVVEMINNSNANMLFVAMGSPRQEYWIAEHKDEINACFCMGVGGTFDVVGGKTKRAPKFVRNIGVEFLFRFIHEPKRWKRVLTRFKFALMVIKEKLAFYRK